jgi:hypothetical protein
MANILWQGSSRVSWQDSSGKTCPAGDPIVVLATKAFSSRTANRKTGDMWQLYIVRSDVSPTAAIQQGLDGAVCGNCIHRNASNADGKGTCYTYGLTVLGADGMFEQYRDGRSGTISPGDFAGSRVRIGAYGDPAACPTELWRDVTTAADGYTSYTHQWRTCDQELSRYAMASCDNLADQVEANAMGWNAYTTLPVGVSRVKGAIPCPFETKGVQCITCLRCSGTGTGRKGNVSIEVHGSRKARFTGEKKVG